jgi:hypothetical protein
MCGLTGQSVYYNYIFFMKQAKNNQGAASTYLFIKKYVACYGLDLDAMKPQPVVTVAGTRKDVDCPYPRPLAAAFQKNLSKTTCSNGNRVAVGYRKRQLPIILRRMPEDETLGCLKNKCSEKRINP